MFIDKSGLLRYYNLHFIGIVPDTPSQHKHQVSHTPKPNLQRSANLTSKPDAASSMSRSQCTSANNSTKNEPTLPPNSCLEAIPTTLIVSLNYVSIILRLKRKTTQITNSGAR